MGQLVRAADGSNWYLPLFLAVTTGLRRGEILGLRWGDVDLANKRLHVSQVVSETKGQLQFKEPKTARGRRVVTLPNVTVEALKAYRAEQAVKWLALGVGRDDATLLFSDDGGNALVPSSMTKAVSYFLAKIGAPWASLKTLRHSHATQLLKSGTHPKVASERLGHSSVSITLDIYSHVLPSMQEDAATAIDAAMRPSLERKDDKK
jgi:integrase